MREMQRSITSRSSHSVATPTPPSDMRTAPCHRADHPGSAHARLAGSAAAAGRKFTVGVSNSHADTHTWAPTAGSARRLYVRRHGVVTTPAITGSDHDGS